MDVEISTWRPAEAAVSDSASGLFGRESELERVSALLTMVHEGRSGVLVVRGKAGVGKTALLDAAARTSGVRPVRVAGAESEMELVFAGLHQLCAPLLDSLPALPVTQQRALEVALGLSVGPVPDRFLVGLAVLTLVTEASRRQPRIWLVDDAQWLDRASLQALSFVARRLVADPVAMVFAARDEKDERLLAGLPELHLEGLRDREARLLLNARFPGRLDERVREQILHEAQGNPLALLELPKRLTSEQLAGGYSPAGREPVTDRIGRGFAAEVQALPVETQLLLLVAAADPIGEAPALLNAAEALGIPANTVTAAEAAGLVTIDRRVSFRHPLIRSVVYSSAPLSQRRAVHAALAGTINPESEPDRVAWHLAQAASGPNEQIAAQLERAAERARARGGVAASAAFLSEAAALTPDRANRGARALAAAQDKLESGAPSAALQLLATAETLPLTEHQRALTALLRAKTAHAVPHGRNNGASALLAAAERFRPLDAGLSRETYLEALEACMFAGRFSDEVGEVARAAMDAPPPSKAPTATDLLLEGLALRGVEGYTAAAPRLAAGLREFLREDKRGHGNLRWYVLAAQVAFDLWDPESWETLAARQVRLLRDSGLLTLLPVALATAASVYVNSGRLAEAQALLDESSAITGVTGAPPPGYIEPFLSANQGREDETLRLAETITRNATSRGEGRIMALVHYSSAVLHNGLRQFPRALAATSSAVEYDDIGLYNYALAERVEAAVGSGCQSVAQEALRQLEERARTTKTCLGLGLLMRSRALLAQGANAEDHYLEAIKELQRSSAVVIYLARTHLVYGEWLHRQGRFDNARVYLRRARDMFLDMHADGFAERAAVSLRALGDSTALRQTHAAEALTTTELTVARLASDGHSNNEIAAQLFLSPRTVEWHLTKIFRQLGISSRRSLRAALREAEKKTPL